MDVIEWIGIEHKFPPKIVNIDGFVGWWMAERWLDCINIRFGRRKVSSHD